MKNAVAFLLIFIITLPAFSQVRTEDIYSDFVLSRQRASMEKDLRQRVIAQTFSLVPDSDNEYRYASACDAISQFQFSGSAVQEGFRALFNRYDSLEYETRESFLEAVFAVAENRYANEVTRLLEKETDARLFCICAAHLYRQDTSAERSNFLKIKMVEQFPGYDTIPVLAELMDYLTFHTRQMRLSMPDMTALFRHQHSHGQKIIYSLQRWNRNYAGLAVIQNPDGRFARDANGKLLLFEQLARSGSGLPYFITNGNTPQGIYSIQGTDVSRNHFIGPSPNIQTIMPFEKSWEKYFREMWMPGSDSLQLYKQLLPESWRRYKPMMESWGAGKAGRTEIIAHGTALDPEYFKDKPYYPLTPTMGCLCAKEIWDPETGRLRSSDQCNMVNAFRSVPGNTGYLFVINLDNQEKAVSRAEVELLVRKFETGK